MLLLQSSFSVVGFLEPSILLLHTAICEEQERINKIAHAYTMYSGILTGTAENYVKIMDHDAATNLSLGTRLH